MGLYLKCGVLKVVMQSATELPREGCSCLLPGCLLSIYTIESKYACLHVHFMVVSTIGLLHSRDFAHSPAFCLGSRTHHQWLGTDTRTKPPRRPYCIAEPSYPPLSFRCPLSPLDRGIFF